MNKNKKKKMPKEEKVPKAKKPDKNKTPDFSGQFGSFPGL